MTRLRTLTIVGALAASLGRPTGVAGQAQPDPDSVAVRVAKGKALFQGKGLCFSCHGKEGEGLLAPSTRLVGRALIHAKPTLPDLIALIKAGVDSAHSTINQPMPARGGSRISDTELEAVAWYVMDLQRRHPPR